MHERPEHVGFAQSVALEDDPAAPADSELGKDHQRDRGDEMQRIDPSPRRQHCRKLVVADDQIQDPGTEQQQTDDCGQMPPERRHRSSKSALQDDFTGQSANPAALPSW